MPALGLACILSVATFAQAASGLMLQGNVVDQAGKPVADASVDAEQTGGSHLKTKTDAQGIFTFALSAAGSYSLTAMKAGLTSGAPRVVRVRDGEQQKFSLVLQTRQLSNGTAIAPGNEGMEFADAPTFTVAGVTDWTAVGGHGSDATLRTSEDLARETAALKEESKYKSKQNSGGDAHRLAGDLDEKQGDALAAVKEYQEAVRLDPSEANYFAWGSELLLHRAVWQAAEVFRNVASEP